MDPIYKRLKRALDREGLSIEETLPTKLSFGLPDTDDLESKLKVTEGSSLAEETDRWTKEKFLLRFLPDPTVNPRIVNVDPSTGVITVEYKKERS